MVMQILTSTTDFIKDVKSRVTIRQVVEFYGFTPNRQHMISCPFHSEKTPSLRIYDDTNSFYCFGSCKTGGDSIEFVSELFKLTPYKAALKLNSDLGLNIRPPTTETSQNAPAPKPKESPLTEYEKQRQRKEWTLSSHDILFDYLKMLERFGKEYPQRKENGEIIINWKYAAYCDDYEITKYIVESLVNSKASREEIAEIWYETVERLKNNFIKNLKKEVKQDVYKRNT